MKPCLCCLSTNYECLKCPYLEDESRQWKDWIDILHLQTGSGAQYNDYNDDKIYYDE